MIKIGDILEGKLSMNASGSAYMVSPDLPKDIYIHKSKTKDALHLDTIKIKVHAGNGRGLEGQVIEVVSRFRTEFVGTIEIAKNHAFFVPDSNKMPVDFYIPLKKLMGAKDGQKVVAKLTDWGKKGPNGEIVRVLGYAGDNETEIHSILEEYGLPYEFEEHIIDEAEAIEAEIKPAEIAARRDMRDVLTFTIDPVDAKDFDDALSVEFVDGNTIVGIHIADVSHYLRPDTDLDKEAYRRGTSVYLVDRVVPMLPERLSNGLCSLRPNETKLTFSAVFEFDKDANIVDEWYGRTVINSDHRYSYEEAQEVIENQGEGGRGFSDIEKAVVALDVLAKKLRTERFKHGSISFDKQEVRFKLDAKNKPVELIFKHMKDSNQLIEEFMLLANKKVAQLVNDKEWPMVNRGHEEPNPEKLAQLKTFIKQFDYDIKTDSPEEITRTLNALLLSVRGKSEENMITNLVVRSMQKANYITKNVGHYGLGFKDYTHFTSPIRRYPDVLVHRILGRFLESKTPHKMEKLDAKCTYLSERERKAQKAERDSIKYMQALYMSERVGRVYQGIVTSVSDFGLFVEIAENKCEGLVKMVDIGGDTFIPDTVNYCVKGYNTGEIIRLGDKVNIVVKSVDIEKKNINFTLIRL